MAQHDMNIADGSGAAVRSDINGALEALATCQMGATAPSPTWPLMWWGDTTNGVLKQRNAANTAWISRGDLSGRFLQEGDLGSISALKPGTLLYWPSDTPPSWALECDGSEISRATYADLFALIGTTFGAGDGSTTFNIPDLRGEFIRGWDNGRGVDAGRSFGSSQLDQMQRITGGVSGFTSRGFLSSYSGALTATGSQPIVQSQTTSNGYNNISFDSADSPGARVGDETRPRNVALLPCIAY